MKTNDRMVLVGVGLLILVAAFWFMVLSPKREEVSTLDGQVDELNTQVSQQEQLLAAAEDAKKGYSSNYHRLVVLGKAVPAGEDTASLFVELNEIADQSEVGLDTIKLTQASGAAATSATPTTTAPATGDAAAAPAEGTTDASSSSTTSSTTTSETTASSAPAPAPATEAAAAGLPIGATVGAAGLPVMPYELELRGNFFQLADFFKGLDELVGSKRGRQIVDGRLVTIDGFELKGDQVKGFPNLEATLELTTFVTPADQGATGGATAAAPATAATSTESTTTTTETTSSATP